MGVVVPLDDPRGCLLPHDLDRPGMARAFAPAGESVLGRRVEGIEQGGPAMGEAGGVPGSQGPSILTDGEGAVEDLRGPAAPTLLTPPLEERQH